MKKSQKKQAILDFIVKHNNSKGYSPTVREVGEAVGLRAASNVLRYLVQLEADGMLKRIPLSARSIEVIGERNSPDEVIVVEKQDELPSVIIWQGRRYIFEPLG